MKRISSRQNPLVKRIRGAIRDHADEIAIEGPKQIGDALEAGWNPILLARSEELDVSPGNEDWLLLSRDVFASLAETRNSQGAIALFERPVDDAAPILGRLDTVAIALDGVQDPGNVGTIVRLAGAFDAAGVLLLHGCADPFGPKAVRSSAGAILRVPVATVTIDALIGARLPLIATAMEGTATDPPSHGAILIFGNEGAGVSQELLQRASAISIPMSHHVESLNVASAAAILLARSFALR